MGGPVAAQADERALWEGDVTILLALAQAHVDPVPTKNSIRMFQGAAARYQSRIMRRAGTRDEVRRRGEARQCALCRVNQPFLDSDIVWLVRDVFAPRDSK